MTTSSEVSTVNAPAVVSTRPGSALAFQGGQERFNDSQVAALRALGVENVPQAELDVFFHQCVRTGLDPFLRQVYLIGRNEGSGENKRVKYTIQTGIDGFRLIARRAALREEQDLMSGEAEWCGPDGIWKPIWADRTTPPAAARVIVLRGREKHVGTALYNEYVQIKKGWQGAPDQPAAMWAKMPAHMLAKCAEALALRKAFPHDLSGIYSDDEYPTVVDTEGNVVETGGNRRVGGGRMRAAVEAEGTPVTVPTSAVAGGELTEGQLALAAEVAEAQRTAQQRTRLAELFRECNAVDVADKLDLVSAALDREVKDPRSLTPADVDVVVSFLEARLRARAEEEAAAAAPAAKPEPDAAVEEAVNLIDKDGPLMRRLMVVLGKAEPDADLRHAHLGDVLGFDVEHYTDLTDEQARTAIAKMEGS